MKKIVLLFITGLFLTGCSVKDWEKTPEGVIVNLKGKTGQDARKIKLEVISDKIIHVIASPSTDFSTDKSLCIAKSPELVTPVFEVDGDENYVTVSTAEIKAGVSLGSGQITFYDRNDNVILREPESGGKSFKPFSVEGTDGFSMQQIFESPVDEAFYGLGQHQSDEFNYKGLNESLYQYNTKVSNPFVVSNRNYGIIIR